MTTRRKRRSREQWSAILKRQATSGQTITEFCRANSIGLASFGKWKRRLANQTPVAPKTQDDFHAVNLVDTEPSEHLSPDNTTVTLSLGTLTLTIQAPGITT